MPVDTYVADSHVLLWYFFNPSKLSLPVSNVFQRVEKGQARIIVSMLVLTEIGMIVEKGRVPVTAAELEQVMAKMQASASYRFVPLRLGVVKRALSLTALPDIFDRVIAAEALVRRIPLLTKDPLIHQSGAVPCIW